MSVQFCCLARNPGEVAPGVPTFVHYTPRLESIPQTIGRAQLVLGAQPEAVATALLEAGVSRVFVAEAALRDSSLVQRLLKRFGAARVGLHVPVQRQAVSWSFDSESNADFSVVTPSLCQPAWEVLNSAGEPCGVRAAPWIDEMVARGVQTVLLRADIRDDADLNLCAGMVETLGDKLWLAPLSDPLPPVADWIAYGQARQLVLPTALYLRRREFLPPASPSTTHAATLRA